ncbi:MAG: protein translocase subunit SecD, partial [Oligoflexia bacterium]|nr:protein translocase subunit SecD [Oligoflexia bacterium]
MFVESLKARFVILSVSFLLGLIYLTPNFISLKDLSWWPSKNKLVYGLDIQGGLHLVLSADVDEIVQERLNRQGIDIKSALAKEDIKTSLSTSSKKPFFLFLKLEKEEDRNRAVEWIKKSRFSSNLQILETKPSQIKLAYYETRVTDLKEQAIKQSIEVIRNRIDEFGVSEPLISAQGEDRILVQLPGIEDSKRAKELIQKTARLELAIVNTEFPAEKLQPLIQEVEKSGGYSMEDNTITYREYVRRINADLKSKLPENSRIVFEKAPSALNMKAGKIPYLVDMNQSIQGGLLEDASVAFDPDTNNPLVSFRFQPEGRKSFSNLTGKSIGKQLAVILDNVLKSAPNVQSRISDRGQISLGAGNYDEMLNEANMIATSLRAGALPAHLHQLEEKTVGPTLGKDSIEKGKKAGMIGLVLVILFMLFYYKSLGVIANISLIANMYFLLALMSSLSATLTLPGVAGIILTIGMAVDANVIIFERIKEELRKGASLKLAVKDGFGNAFSAILDANITTAIVCFVLIYFSSGPVRGFAV